jgi:hypothetical protein
MRQCKERWTYYLSPRLNHQPWTEDEDAQLIEKQAEYGAKWVRIAQFFPNRTDAMVTNRFQMLQRRRTKDQRRQERKTNKPRCARLAEKSQQESLPVDFLDAIEPMGFSTLEPPVPEISFNDFESLWW